MIDITPIVGELWYTYYLGTVDFFVITNATRLHAELLHVGTKYVYTGKARRARAHAVKEITPFTMWKDEGKKDGKDGTRKTCPLMKATVGGCRELTAQVGLVIQRSNYKRILARKVPSVKDGIERACPRNLDAVERVHVGDKFKDNVTGIVYELVEISQHGRSVFKALATVDELLGKMQEITAIDRICAAFRSYVCLDEDEQLYIEPPTHKTKYAYKI